MRDHVFFPLAAVLAGAFVLMAMQPWADRPPSGPASCGQCPNPEDKTIAGEELHRFVPGTFNGLQILKPEDGSPPILRITRLESEQYDNPQSGPHVTLAEDLEFAFEGRPIEVIVTARSVGDFAADKFEVDYYAKADGESGWREFPLTREFADYAFTWSTPPRGGVTGYDFLAIRPVAPDKRRTMEVKSVRIRGAGPKR